MGRKAVKPESEKKEEFIRRFAYHRDPVEAAQEAGYANPRAASRRLLLDKSVQSRVEEITSKAVECAGLNVSFVLNNLVRVVEYGMQEVEALDSRGEPVCLRGGGEAFKLMNSRAAMQALDSLGRYFGMYKDKVEVTGAVDVEALEAARQRVIEMQVETPGLEWEKADGDEC